MMKLRYMLHILLLVLYQCWHVVANTDFSGCYDRLRGGTFGLDGAVDSNGHKVSDLAQAVGLTYQACKANCGSGAETFTWRIFSQQFTAWLLPWLALVSQLPYGANDGLSNCETMLLTVGSPMLAAYSLALAVTSNRWMVKRFRWSTHRNCFFAAKILSSLQQVSFTIADEDILTSLIALPENDSWWRKLEEALDYSGSQWTLAAIMSMGYVMLAYIFTWVDTLQGQLTAQVFANGQSIGSIWLSLLPIVICSLQLSPKSDAGRIKRAVEAANKTFYVATDSDPPKQSDGIRNRAIIVETEPRDKEYEDQICPTSICFYTRIFSWVRSARRVTNAFDAVSQYPYIHDQDSDKEPRTISDVRKRCKLPDNQDTFHFWDNFSIYVTSAFFAIFLQWGTTGAAIMAIYLTPTRGFGCRSASYLLYGTLSTIVWLLLVISSILARCCASSKKLGISTSLTVVILRQIAKAVAAVNTVWILISSLFQFSSIYDNCYCNSSVLGLGSAAYAVLEFTSEDQKLTKLYWTGGMIMATGTALLFISAINLLMKQPEQHSSSE